VQAVNITIPANATIIIGKPTLQPADVLVWRE